MKKNFLAIALLFAVLSSNAQVQFLKSVNYRGAFAPSPTVMWTSVGQTGILKTPVMLQLQLQLVILSLQTHIGQKTMCTKFKG